ncbi:penicillin-binding transpeptidase domain-containing protein [Streptomyces sp. NPDC049687]|uniref:penicillin-binding transpeptidase domain-containing protein n=1 Tax=Streptomyces sp. NPDC049687 TaxID=3365596 RepID=UPI003799F55E
MGKRRRVDERRSKRRPAVVGGMIAVVVGGAGFGVYALYDGGAAAEDGSAGKKLVVKSGPPSAAEVTSTAQTFLTAWQRGEVTRAAAVTDDSTAASALLTGYTKDAHITDVTLTAGTRTGGKVPFSVKATVTYKKVSKPLSYESALTVVRAKNGKPLVDWHASVVHPALADGDTLVTGEAGDPPVKALDRDGGEITAAKYPSLGTVLDGLREKYGKKAGGTAGVELRVARGKASKAKKSSDKTLLELSKGTPGTVKTTLSPTLQAAAEQQVAKTARASVVVLRPSTGEILAVANTNHGFNTAFNGSLAPGSTMKVITSSLLIEKGLASADKVHPCPKTFTYGGWKFHNDDDFKITGGTFKASFARSCNTAFISQAPDLDNDSLTKQAQQVFGLSMNNWAIGVPTFDGSVPVQSAAQMAASLIGQGGVRMNPLNMASVAATVKSGAFHQPYLVSPSVDDRAVATASRTMSSATLSQLRELMNYTAAYGTAAEAMSGLGPDDGAKTGSAEVDGQSKPNGWFTAYRGDLAAAGVVQAGGHGGDTAGPIVASLLRMGG